jgi:hypothetical protein
LPIQQTQLVLSHLMIIGYCVRFRNWKLYTMKLELKLTETHTVEQSNFLLS